MYKETHSTKNANFTNNFQVSNHFDRKAVTSSFIHTKGMWLCNYTLTQGHSSFWTISIKKWPLHKTFNSATRFIPVFIWQHLPENQTDTYAGKFITCLFVSVSFLKQKKVLPLLFACTLNLVISCISRITFLFPLHSALLTQGACLHWLSNTRPHTYDSDMQRRL